MLAATNIGTGEVLFDANKSHKAADVLAFIKCIDLHGPKDLGVHVVLDNLSAHEASPVATWLGDPSGHIGTCTSRRPARRGSTSSVAGSTSRRDAISGGGAFTSLPNLIEATEIWTEHGNDDPEPCVWHKPPEEIIARV